MFPTSQKTRRATPRHAHHSCCRPLLEQLEDRVVPSIADGTILLGNLPGSPSSTAPTGIVGVNPHTGAQSVISAGGMFSVPDNVREASTDDTTLYVTDYAAFPGSGGIIGGAVFRVDANTGHQSVVAKGGLINGPAGLAVIHDLIYISNVGDDTGSFNNIIEINPSNGHQRLISSGGNFSSPLGIAPAPGNNIYVSDIRAFGTGAIFEVSLVDGHQTVISKGGVLRFPVDMSVDGQGNPIVFNRDSATDFTVGSGSVLRINPHTGAQTILASNGLLSALDGGTLARDGTIYAGTTITVPPTVPARIIGLNPVTGALHIVSQGHNLEIVEGMTVYYKHGGGGAETPPSAASAVALHLRPLQPESTEMARPAAVKPSLLITALPYTEPVRLDSQPLSIMAFAEATTGAFGISRAQGTSVPATALEAFFADWENVLDQVVLFANRFPQGI